jgi:hypothetical protein
VQKNKKKMYSLSNKKSINMRDAHSARGARGAQRLYCPSSNSLTGRQGMDRPLEIDNGQGILFKRDPTASAAMRQGGTYLDYNSISLPSDEEMQYAAQLRGTNNELDLESAPRLNCLYIRRGAMPEEGGLNVSRDGIFYSTPISPRWRSCRYIGPITPEGEYICDSYENCAVECYDD